LPEQVDLGRGVDVGEPPPKRLARRLCRAKRPSAVILIAKLVGLAVEDASVDRFGWKHKRKDTVEIASKLRFGLFVVEDKSK